jgi:hypothetical protein
LLRDAATVVLDEEGAATAGFLVTDFVVGHAASLLRT